MRKTKAGGIRLPREAWRIAAATHRDVVSQLLVVVRETLDEARQASAEKDQSTRLFAVDVTVTTVVGKLLNLIQEHELHACVYEVRAKKVRRGRPAAVVLNGLQVALMDSLSKKPKDLKGAQRDALLYKVIEERRTDLGAPIRRVTVTAAIKSLSDQWAAHHNKAQHTVFKDHLNIFKAGYQRGKKAL